MKKINTCSMDKKEIEADCILWAQEISQDYKPDLLVFIAKSGFLFANPMVEIFGCEMVDVIAGRPNSEAKNMVQGLIKRIPEKWILTIISSPFMYWLNEWKGERNIELSSRFLRESGKQHKKILVVDDSVDTGWTIFHVKKEIQKYFPQAELKIASYAVVEYSRKRIKVDYYRYQNKIILTATSRKSNQYEAFLQDYEKWANI